MKIDILTLFPEMFSALRTSILGRAQQSGKIEINIIDIRDFTLDKHKKCDDTPYGGGAGMLIRCEPIFECIDKIKTKDSYIIMLTPSGKTFNQKKAIDLSKKNHLIFICGHYEGFDERITTLVDEEISIGDFVLTGGEVPAMCMVDAITRLLPGVINNKSLESESFNDNLLDFPMYTKPSVYRGLKVPEVLLNGNHKEIEIWRKENQKKKTMEKRPDLMEK